MKLSTYCVLGRPEDIEPVLGIIAKYTQFKHKPDSPDFFIVVGGDGSLVYKPNREKVYNSRILRVHYRKDHDMTLGCAADVNLTNLDIALKDIVDGNYFLQEEKLIDCFINGEKKDSAINDVSIVNDKQLDMLLFDAVLYVGRRKETLPLSTADMILVSTPYGSRAWAANTGGPIVIDLPNSMTINITGTSIKHEHFVTSSKNTLRVEVLCDALVGIDGRNPVYKVKNGDKISVRGSSKRVSFIRTYNTLESSRNKQREYRKFARRLSHNHWFSRELISTFSEVYPFVKGVEIRFYDVFTEWKMEDGEIMSGWTNDSDSHYFGIAADLIIKALSEKKKMEKEEKELTPKIIT